MEEQRNVRPELSKADEDSILYKKTEPKTEKQKLKELHGKDKLWYLLQYYGLQALIAAAVIGLAAYLIVHYTTQKDTALEIMAVNAEKEQDAAGDDSSYYEAFLQQNGLDPEKCEVLVSSNLGASTDENDSVSVESIQMIQSRFLTQSVDVFFSDYDFFYSLGEFDYFADVRTYLTDEQMETYADQLVEVTSTETGETYPIGIRLQNNAWIADAGWYQGECVVGLAAGLKNADLAVTFLDQEILEETE